MAHALDKCGDEELARYAGAGSDRALDALYDRHAQGVLRYCRALLRHPDDADDAAQETWMAVVRAFRGPSGGGREAFRPWLYTIARHECVDRFRRRARESGTELSEDELRPAPAADRVYEARADMAAAIGDIARLPEPSRSALALRELAGLDQGEVASSLGLSVQRTGRLLAEARRTLTDRRAGRAMACEEVRRAISRLRVRNVRVRGHIESCPPCRSFECQVRGRKLTSLAVGPSMALRGFVERLAALAGTGRLAGAAAVVGSSAVAAGAALTLSLPPPGHAGAADTPGRAAAPASVASTSGIAAPAAAGSPTIGRSGVRRRDRGRVEGGRSADERGTRRGRRADRPEDVRARPRPASPRDGGGAREPAPQPASDVQPPRGGPTSPVDSAAQSATDAVVGASEAVRGTAGSLGDAAQPVGEIVSDTGRTVTSAASSPSLPAAGPGL